MISADPAAFASAGDLLLRALDGFAPPERSRLADWTARKRWLSNSGGGHVGLWDHTRAPYLVEPMNALTSGLYTTTALVGPAQCGKTEVAVNWLLQSVDEDPAKFLWYMQTDDSLRAYVKSDLNPKIEAHPEIVARRGQEPGDDAIGFKRFRGMSVELLSATRGNVINKNAPRIVADEWDAWDVDLGDPKTVLDPRRQTYGSASMLLGISHPDRASGIAPKDWNAGIMSLYRTSTRHTWWWPCPHCEGFSSPNPGTVRHCSLEYPQDAPPEVAAREAHLLCPLCGCEIRDDQRHAMNLRGEWVGRGQEMTEDGVVIGELEPNETAGFWIVGVMSPFALGGIGGLAAARVKAEQERDGSGDDKALRTVMSKNWGVPFQPRKQVGTIDATALADRAEPGQRIGLVPEWVRFLTGAVDVQGTRFEWLVRGWGENGRSCVIQHGVVKADTATSPGDWDDLLRDLLTRAFPLADGSGRGMRLLSVGYDSGGQEGVTLQAYGAWFRARQLGLARRFGTWDGRETWNLLPLKGASGLNAQRLVVVRPDSARRDRRASATGTTPLGVFNPNTFKDDLAVQLAVALPGPWHVTIPYAMRGDYPAEPRRDVTPHLWFEQLVAERRKKNGGWEKAVSSARNEATDLMVMTHVMAHLHGLARIRWESPPAWAAAAEFNPFVVPMTTERSANGDVPASPPLLAASIASKQVIRSSFVGRVRR